MTKRLTTNGTHNPVSMALEIFGHLGSPNDPDDMEVAVESCKATALAVRSIGRNRGARALLVYVLQHYDDTSLETVAKALEQTAGMLKYKPEKETLRG